MRITFFPLLLLICLMACKNDQAQSDSDGSISSIVNMPIGPDQIIDTSVAAHLKFEETLIDWDTIQTGKSFTHVFRYTNTGKRPAIISDVKTSCGCTATTYTTDPVQPGETGKIEVTFNSFGRLGYQKKSINVIGNTYPPRTLLYLQGFVSK
ncbi:MAG TPA: DUF1573 domain-containing protein [Membranihabitans sp.]|nr:DUF1573 domain-containing protein [Membranihabitans sp.]